MRRNLTYLKNVASLDLNRQLCVGCGMCMIVCPHAVMEMQNEKAIIADRDACMECGACARNCPTGAVTVDAGVGCAAAVINAALGRSGDECCCVAETGKNRKTGCC